MVRSHGFARGAFALLCLGLSSERAGADCTEDSYPNPSSYFEFEDVSSGFIEDTVGTHIGVLYGSPGTDTGIVGDAVAWDGVNDYALLDEYAELEQDMTFATWVRYHSPNNTGALISKFMSPAYAWQLGTYSAPRYLQAYAKQEGAGGMKFVFGPNTDGMFDVWHHVAMTYDGQVLALYFDGSLVGSTSWASSEPLLISDLLVRLGARYGGGTPFVHADMDETALWNDALSAAQLSDVYLRGIGAAKLFEASSCPATPSADLSNFVVDNDVHLPADGTSTYTAAVTLKLRNGQPAAGVTVGLEVTGSGNIVSNPVQTDANGEATLTLATTVAETKTLSIVADPNWVPMLLDVTREVTFQSPTCTGYFPPPIAYYPMDDVSTGTVSDAVGVHPGIVYGPQATSAGLVGNALDTHIGGDWVELDELSEVGEAITFGLWLFYESNTTGELVSKWNNNPYDSYAMTVRASSSSRNVAVWVSETGDFDGNLSQNGTWISGPNLVPLIGEWHHHVYVYDGQTLSQYVDGAHTYSRSFASPGDIWTSTLPVRIGRTHAPTTNYIVDGLIDEVIFFDEALDDDQVAALYHRGYAGLTAYDVSGCLPEVSDTNSTVVASPTIDILADGEDASTVTVTVKDDGGTPLPGRYVTLFAVSGTDPVVTQPLGPTDANGEVIGFLGSDVAENVEIGAIVDPGPEQVVLTDTATVAFLDPGPQWFYSLWQFPTLGGQPLQIQERNGNIGVFAGSGALDNLVEAPSATTIENWVQSSAALQQWPYLAGQVHTVGELTGGTGAIFENPLVFYGEEVNPGALAGGNSSMFGLALGQYYLSAADTVIMGSSACSGPGCSSNCVVLSNATICVGMSGGVPPQPSCDCGPSAIDQCGTPGTPAPGEPPIPEPVCTPGEPSCAVGDITYTDFGEDVDGGSTCMTICPFADCDPSAPGPGGGNGGGTPSVGIEAPGLCIAESGPPQVDRHCQQVAGGNNCPGMCWGQETGDCYFLGDDPTAGPYEEPDCYVAECNYGAGAPGTCCNPAFDKIDDFIEEKAEQLLANDEVFGEELEPQEQFLVCARSSDFQGGVCAKGNCDQGDVCPWGLIGADIGDITDPANSGLRCKAGQGDDDICAVCGEITAWGCVPTTALRDSLVARPVLTANEENTKEPGTEAEQATEPLGEAAEDPITLASGELVFSATDLAFEGIGLDFAFSRNYRSGGAEHGMFGPGFHHSLEERIELVGDKYNRHSAPAYCNSAYPIIRCLYHYDANGARRLYVFDYESGVYSGPPGSFSTIRLDVKDASIAEQTGRFVMLQPGGTTREYDVLGHLRKVRDAYGNAIELGYRIRTLDEVKREGNGNGYNGTLYDNTEIEKYGVYFPGAVQPDPNDEGQLHTNTTSRNAFFNQVELTTITDTYGRVFTVEYNTFSEAGNLGANPADRAEGDSATRRRRPTAITFRGETVVSYDYTWFALTDDAYLTKITRTGFTDGGTHSAETLTTHYEFNFDVVTDHFVWETATDEAPSATTAFGQAIATALQTVHQDVKYCGRRMMPDPEQELEAGMDPASGCNSRPYSYTQLPISEGDTLGTRLRKILADNIVRVYTGDTIADPSRPDVETYFVPNPLSPDFDRAVKQRYGAAPLAGSPLNTTESVGSDTVFVWKSQLPEASLVQTISGQPDAMFSSSTLFPTQEASYSGALTAGTGYRDPDTLEIITDPDFSTIQPVVVPNNDQNGLWHSAEFSVVIPQQILNAVPVEGALTDDNEPMTDFCRHLDSIGRFPKFKLRDPALKRNDTPTSLASAPLPSIRRSEYSCAAIAARHNRDAFVNENVRYFDDDTLDDRYPDQRPEDGLRRIGYEYDLARVCRWVKNTNREGEEQYFGLNFSGQTIVHAKPAADESGDWSITKRVFNADGLLVKETRPDGGGVEIEYAMQNPDGTDFEAAPGGIVLYRANPVKLTEYVADTVANPHLEDATAYAASGSETTISQREWNFVYEALFQQLGWLVPPDGQGIAYFAYQYQGLPEPTLTQMTPGEFNNGMHAGIRNLVASGVPVTFLQNLLTAPQGNHFFEFYTNTFDGGGYTLNAGNGLSVEFVSDVPTGNGAAVVDVGTRYIRDTKGRVRRQASIKDWADDVYDTDEIVYGYYDDLASAEAASFGSSTVCADDEPSGIDASTIRGPLARVVTKQTPGASLCSNSASHVTYAYDALGGVRLARANGDPDTDQVTERNSLGRIVERSDAYGYAAQYVYNDRSEIVQESHRDGSAYASPDQVIVHAYGLGDVKYGSCQESVSGACTTFPTLAANVVAAVRNGTAMPAFPAGAQWSVRVPDLDDRFLAVVDSGDGYRKVTRNATGLVSSSDDWDSATAPSAPLYHREYEYDRDGRLLRTRLGDVASPDPFVTWHKYDALGRRVATQTKALDATLVYSDGHGLVQRVKYDGKDRVTGAYTFGDDGDGTRRVFSFMRQELNSIGEPLYVHTLAQPTMPTSITGTFPTGPAGADVWATERFEYDHVMRPVEYEAEGIDPTTAVYDGFGLSIVTSPTVQRSITRFPLDREVITAVRQFGSDVSVGDKDATYIDHYDGAGRLTLHESIENEILGSTGSLTTAYTYDSFGQAVRTQGADKRAVDRLFDGAGRMVQMDELDRTFLSHRTTNYAYDLAGRLAQTVTSSGQTTDWTFDAVGRTTTKQVTSTSGLVPEGFESIYNYDDIGRTTTHLESKRVSPLDHVTYSYSYAQGETAPDTMSVDAALAKSWVRDDLGRIVEATDENLLLLYADNTELPSEALTTFLEYDSMGRLLGEETAKGTGLSEALGRMDYAYGDDFLGRSQRTFDPDQLDATAGFDTDFFYDPAGNLDEIQRHRQGYGTRLAVSLSHRGGLWTKADIGPVGGSAQYTQTKERDGFGWVRKSGMGLTGSSQMAREVALLGPTGRVMASLRTGGFFGSSAKGYEYDALRRLSRHTFLDDSTPNVAPTEAQFDNERATALLDEENIFALSSFIEPPDVDVATSFNLNDNLQSAAVDEYNRTFAASFNTAAAGSPPSAVNGGTVVLDDLHRISSDGAADYTHDALDRFRSISVGSALEMSVLYDGLGRRKMEWRRTGDTSADYELAVLHYDGPNVVEETDFEASTPTILTQTTHAPGIDAPVLFNATYDDGNSYVTYALGTNVRGDVIAAASYDGNTLLENAQLSPWGERHFKDKNGSCLEGTEASGTTSLPDSACADLVAGQGGYTPVLRRFGIAGGRAHPRTKLVDMRNRVYAPHLKGFLARDPLGSVDSHGLWNYVANDPVNMRDPWGLDSGATADDPEPMNFGDDLPGGETSDMRGECGRGTAGASCGGSKYGPLFASEAAKFRRFNEQSEDHAGPTGPTGVCSSSPDGTCYGDPAVEPDLLGAFGRGLKRNVPTLDEVTEGLAQQYGCATCRALEQAKKPNGNDRSAGEIADEIVEDVLQNNPIAQQNNNAAEIADGCGGGLGEDCMEALGNETGQFIAILVGIMMGTAVGKIAGGGTAGKGGKRSKNRVPDKVPGRPNPEQQALIDMAKKDSKRVPQGKGPVSAGDADAYVELGNQAGVPVRAKPNDLSGAHGYGPVPAGPGAEHIHVNGEHIPVPGGYTPPSGGNIIR